MKVFKKTLGIVVSINNKFYKLNEDNWDKFINDNIFLKRSKSLLVHRLWLPISKVIRFHLLATRSYGPVVLLIYEIRREGRKNQRCQAALIFMQKYMKRNDRKCFLNLHLIALLDTKPKSAYEEYGIEIEIF